jgi:hypothetical protein
VLEHGDPEPLYKILSAHIKNIYIGILIADELYTGNKPSTAVQEFYNKLIKVQFLDDNKIVFDGYTTIPKYREHTLRMYSKENNNNMLNISIPLSK